MKNAPFNSLHGREGDILFEHPSILAEQILKACGWGTVLHAGGGDGRLVSELCSRGIDARGVDDFSVAAVSAERRCSARLSHGSALALGVPDCSADIVVVTGCLDGLDNASIDAALHELFRVARRDVYLLVESKTVFDKQEQEITRDRTWWEGRLISAGFRKHPRYFTVTSYEAIERDAEVLALLMEKSPSGVLAHYPLSSLAEERDLHMDMAREAGRRSDAHMIRYHEVAGFIQPGDRVLDVACGLGYGAHVLWHNSLASEVIGIDASAYAVRYASFAYGVEKVVFREGRLPEVFGDMPDGSVDFIASFETLEHLDDPESFLSACRRILSPGGRIAVSVPNDWSDETGYDPNPHHLHLYSWDKLIEQVSASFVPERAFAQSASRKKVDAKWERALREWRALPVSDASTQASEWCILVAMRDPSEGQAIPYREGLFPHRAVESKPALLDFVNQYRNPWLVRSMISIGPRMSSPVELERMSDKVLIEGPGGADEAAALCVKAYRALERGATEELKALLEQFGPHLNADHIGITSPIAMRWAVSLWYVKALIELSVGMLDVAEESLRQCAMLPFDRYAPLLATKTVDAAFRLAGMQYARGEHELARQSWRLGLDAGRAAAQCDWESSFGSLDAPPDFALREMTEVLDLTTRCATALSLFEQLDRPAALLRVLFNKTEYARNLTSALTATQESCEQLGRERTIERANFELDIQALQARLVAEQTRRAYERREHSSALEALDAEHRSASAALTLVRSELAVERQDVMRYRGWVPTYRWLLGHIRRKVFGKGLSILAPRSPDRTAHEDRLIVEMSGLFDPEWYLAQNPDIAGLDPLDHYLKHGGREGRAAGPGFDSASYLYRYPDVAVAGLNPIVHYVRYGAKEGRTPSAPKRSAMQAVVKTIADASRFEPEIAGNPVFHNDPGLQWSYSFTPSPLYEAWSKLFHSLEHPYDYLVFVPWLVRGGADLVVANVVRAAIERHGANSTLLIVADYDRVETREWLPKNSNIRILSELSPDLAYNDRVRLVETLIMALKPKGVLNVNSRTCWDAFRNRGGALSTITDIYAMLFCHDYTPDGRAAGYASTHFRACLPHLKKVYFDNTTFMQEITAELGLPQSLQQRLVVMPQPVSSDVVQRGFVVERSAGQLPIMWAGRFARQKNVELLIDIASKAPNFQFSVYGEGEESYARQLRDAEAQLSNLSIKGGFSSFDMLPTDQYAAFLFTSLWEGMPTTLISAAAAGIPIIASDVGGVSELVDDETGWLVRDHTDPSGYLKALDEIRSNPEEACSRVTRMLHRVHTKHSLEAFTAAFSSAPSFLD